MNSTILRSALAAMACATALVIASPSYAEIVNLKTTLSGKNEVPPNESKATGAVTVTYDTASKKASWKGSYSGLSGPATAAHFHAANPARTTASRCRLHRPRARLKARPHSPTPRPPT